MAELATIARPYAEALFQVARQGDVAAWGVQVDALAAVAAHPEVRAYADNPKVQPADVEAALVAAVNKSNVVVEAGVQNFLRTLLDNGRLVALPEIALQFRALVNAASGAADAVVHSAFPIDDAQLATLVETLQQRFGRKLSASVVVEPELIGGVRVVVGDQVLDTSVRARLERMKVSLCA